MKKTEKFKKKVGQFVEDHETDILIAIPACVAGAFGIAAGLYFGFGVGYDSGMKEGIKKRVETGWNACATGFRDALVHCAKESGDNIDHIDMTEILKIKTEGA